MAAAAVTAGATGDDVAAEVVAAGPTPLDVPALAPDAVIVTYNSVGHLADCVASLRADGFGRIVVVDNASVDGTTEVAETLDVVLLPQVRNVGFGAGVNIGVRSTTTPYVAIVNPDSVVEPGARAALVSLLDRVPEVAAVGPRIDTPEGELYPSARRFPDLPTALGHAVLTYVRPRNRFSRRYRMLDWDHASAAVVDWVAGTFMLVRRDVFLGVGGFDERYFMYVEDVDLCWRLREAGHLVAFEPLARIRHTIGGSTEQRPLRMIVEHHRSLYRYASRTALGWKRALLPVLAVGLALRVVASWLQRGVRRKPPAAP